MENKKQVPPSSSSSSSSLDHLFGPKDSNSSSSTGFFGSIFPKPVVERGRKEDCGTQIGTCKNGNPDNTTTKNSKNETDGMSGKNTSSMYQNETMEPSYFSSSIFYGGQENYSPRNKASESHHIFKKEDEVDDANGSNSNSASRGNWWEGSLYY